MREECEVVPRRNVASVLLETQRLRGVHGEFAKLDEVIPRARSPELLPCFLAVVLRDWRDRPVVVHHIVIPPRFKLRAHAESRLVFDDVCQPVTHPRERARFTFVNGEFHPARDVDSDSVRDHRIFRGKHSADG